MNGTAVLSGGLLLTDANFKLVCGGVVTPVQPSGGGGGGGGSGSGNSCMSYALQQTPGATTSVSMRHDGPSGSGDDTYQTRVVGTTIFENQQVTEIALNSTSSTSLPLGLINTTVSGSQYIGYSADAQLTLYGSVLNSTGQTVVSGFTSNSVTSIRSVLSPPFVDKRFTLQTGQQVTQTQIGNSVVSTSAPTVSSSSQPVNSTKTVRFAGVETVTVPAGSYSACKFVEFDPATPTTVLTSWLLLNYGVQLKTQTVSPSGTQTAVATSVKVNGVSL